MTEENSQVENRKSIFVVRKHVSLGMKLVCTFAITYYILYFLFMTYIVFTYNTVFDRAYFEGNRNEALVEHHYTLFIIQWILLALIITSLFFVFYKKRIGKFLFMILTMILIGCQIFTTFPPAWLTYILEFSMVLIIAPLRILSKFTDRIQIEAKAVNINKEK